MDARTNSNYRSLASVASTIETNKSLKAVTDLPALLKAHTELAQTNAQIADLLESAAQPPGPSPESAAKSDLATGAVESCAELAAAVHAYAVDNGDAQLAAESDYSQSDLAGGSESQIVAKCTKVVSLATGVADELDDYGYAASDVTAIGKAVEAYAKSCPKPRQGVASRSASNKEVKKLVRKGRRIVTSRIDRLMLQVRKTNPEFYNAYKTARKVVNPATTPREEEKKAA